MSGSTVKTRAFFGSIYQANENPRNLNTHSGGDANVAQIMSWFTNQFENWKLQLASGVFVSIFDNVTIYEQKQTGATSTKKSFKDEAISLGDLSAANTLTYSAFVKGMLQFRAANQVSVGLDIHVLMDETNASTLLNDMTDKRQAVMNPSMNTPGAFRDMQTGSIIYVIPRSLWDAYSVLAKDGAKLIAPVFFPSDIQVGSYLPTPNQVVGGAGVGATELLSQVIQRHANDNPSIPQEQIDTMLRKSRSFIVR